MKNYPVDILFAILAAILALAINGYVDGLDQNTLAKGEVVQFADYRQSIIVLVDQEPKYFCVVPKWQRFVSSNPKPGGYFYTYKTQIAAERIGPGFFTMVQGTHPTIQYGCPPGTLFPALRYW